jgi:hypothetical protein
MALCDLADNEAGIHQFTTRASRSNTSRWIIASRCRSTVLNAVPFNQRRGCWKILDNNL